MYSHTMGLLFFLHAKIGKNYGNRVFFIAFLDTDGIDCLDKIVRIVIFL